MQQKAIIFKLGSQMYRCLIGRSNQHSYDLKARWIPWQHARPGFTRAWLNGSEGGRVVKTLQETNMAMGHPHLQ